MANFIMGIITLSIGVVIMSSVFILNVKNTNQTGLCWYANGTSYSCAWSSGEIAIWGLLTIVGIAGIIYGLLSTFGIA